MTLSRMHQAGLIAHPHRASYTTLENYAESQKRMEERRKELKEDLESLKQSFASRTTVTSDANKKGSPKASSN